MSKIFCPACHHCEKSSGSQFLGDNVGRKCNSACLEALCSPILGTSGEMSSLFSALDPAGMCIWWCGWYCGKFWLLATDCHRNMSYKFASAWQKQRKENVGQWWFQKGLWCLFAQQKMWSFGFDNQNQLILVVSSSCHKKGKSHRIKLCHSECGNKGSTGIWCHKKFENYLIVKCVQVVDWCFVLLACFLLCECSIPNFKSWATFVFLDFDMLCIFETILKSTAKT